MHAENWVWLLGKAGVENTRSYRCECPVSIRLPRTEGNGWYSSEHREKHNHSLLPNFGETIHWSSHKAHLCVFPRPDQAIETEQRQPCQGVHRYQESFLD
ncbi:hypothetical protein VPH35_001000 [Triticum aestivum]